MPLINKASIKEQGFQINGDHYKIIVPESIDDLVAAMQIKDMLETELEKHEPDEGHPYYHFLKLQNAVIDDYLSCLGEFDNSIMAKNILFLSKKRGIGMGVLERIIGVSPGYISRTVKENSAKKLSIDNVWKIARLFDISMRKLLEVDMSRPNHNTNLTSRFIEQLCKDTEDAKIQWASLGGAITELDQRLTEIDYFRKDIIYGFIKYRPEHLNPETNFIVQGDIFSYKITGKELIIVPYSFVDEESIRGYDFYFLRRNPNRDDYYIDLAFSTSDDIYGELKSLSDELYKYIELRSTDIPLSLETKNFINNYLN